jgi:hypothetical protein
MATFALLLLVLSFFDKVCQVWPYMVYCAMYGQMWYNMAKFATVFPDLTNFGKAYQIWPYTVQYAKYGQK